MKHRRNVKGVSTLLLAGAVLAGPVLAEEKAPAWTGEAALGFVMTSGNTETQSTNAKAKAVNERDMWRHSLALEALKNEDNDVTTAERYLASGQTNYKFKPRHSLFGLVSYEDDRFSGYDWRATEVVGYGYRAIERPDLILDLEGGPGARQSRLDNGTREDEGIIHLGANLDWKVSPTSNFTEALTSDIGEDVTISKSVTGLKTQINGSLSMKIAYTVKHTSEVPAGIEKVDRETAVMLVYGF
jgi:putative salt-induced outer membrane protein